MTVIMLWEMSLLAVFAAGYALGATRKHKAKGRAGEAARDRAASKRQKEFENFMSYDGRIQQEITEE